MKSTNQRSADFDTGTSCGSLSLFLLPMVSPGCSEQLITFLQRSSFHDAEKGRWWA